MVDLSEWRDFLIDLAAGAIAGFCMVTASHPFEYISNPNYI